MKDIRGKINQAVAKAKDAGIRESWVDRLLELLYRFSNTFKLKMGVDSQANVTPFVTKLKPEAKPYKSKPRRYTVRNKVISSRNLRMN